MLARLGKPLQLAVLVDVDREVLTKRLTGRRGCTSCGAIYNIYFSPPRVPGKCDRCGSVLQHRSDDNEDAVRKRLEVYEAQSAPLVSYYKAQGKLRTVRGIGSVADIFKNICDIIEVQIRPLAAAMSRAEAAAQAALLAARKSSKAASAASASAAKKAATKAAKKAASKKIATKKAVKKVKKVAKKVKKVAKKAAKKAKKKVAKKASRKTTKAQGKKAKKTK
jgi:adenylate kinase